MGVLDLNGDGPVAQDASLNHAVLRDQVDAVLDVGRSDVRISAASAEDARQERHPRSTVMPRLCLGRNRRAVQRQLLPQYLEALRAWLKDSDAYYLNRKRTPPSSGARFLADALRAAKIYE